MLKGQLSRVPWPREVLDPTQLPSWPSGTLAVPQTFLLTPVSYSHSTSTSLHPICFMSSFHFFLSLRGFLLQRVVILAACTWCKLCCVRTLHK